MQVLVECTGRIVLVESVSLYPGCCWVDVDGYSQHTAWPNDWARLYRDELNRLWRALG